MEEPGAVGTQDIQGLPASQPPDSSSLVLCDLGPRTSHRGACHQEALVSSSPLTLLQPRWPLCCSQAEQTSARLRAFAPALAGL